MVVFNLSRLFIVLNVFYCQHKAQTDFFVTTHINSSTENLSREVSNSTDVSTTSNPSSNITDVGITEDCLSSTGSTHINCDLKDRAVIRSVVPGDAAINLDYLAYVTVPSFLVLGLSGNTLTILVMYSKQFRHMSVSIILIVLAISDTCLILLLPFNKHFVRDLLGVDIRSLSPAGCKIFFALFRSAKMTSSWFVVLLCMERFVAVIFPLRAKFICSRLNVVIAILIVYCTIFSFNGAWTFASRIVNGNCLPHFPEPAYLSHIFVTIGTFLYSLIPVCILLILTPIICVKLCQRIKLHQTLNPGNVRIGQEARRITIKLLGVSIAFMVLVTPISICHIVSAIQEDSASIFEMRDNSMVIYREVTQVLEQLNYSINFFLYVLCSKNFRDKVKKVLCCQMGAITRARSQSV